MLLHIMPGRPRVVKVFKSRYQDEDYGKLREQGVSSMMENYPDYTCKERLGAVRDPIIPEIKTLANNPKKFDGRSRTISDFKKHENIRHRPDYIIPETNLRLNSARLDSATENKDRFNASDLGNAHMIEFNNCDVI